MDRIVGRAAPDFNLTACTGDGMEFKKVSLAEYKGKWLILFFYPLNFTIV